MTPVLHLELVEQTDTAFQLRCWRDNPNDVRTRTLALQEVADLVAKAEADYYSPQPARLQEVGARLFRWPDGGERWIAAEVGAVASQAPVLVLAIAMPHRLAHLPWEVLHDGTAFLLHGLNPPVLPMRWHPAAGGGHPTANRPLQLLFMAASPEDVEPVLDYEYEEAAILAATARRPLDLTVEESGCLEELGALVQDYGAGFFDVLHLTGHAGHGGDSRPVFLLETSEGRRADATAVEVAKGLPYRPPLVFLSGCRTGEGAAHGAVRSFAEELLGAGFHAVPGWGRPVLDTDATLAASHLYKDLASGESLPSALVRTHARLREAGARDWHLLRLFCAGSPPAAFVTPVRTPGRTRPAVRLVESEFLDPLTKTVKVAARARFVGRRRLLQRSLRQLRSPDGRHVGLLLHGQGGRGKSSVAARVCDRLRREFLRVIVIGRLDETTLTNAWAVELPEEPQRRALRDQATPLQGRIEAVLRQLADAGGPEPLFVLDDFERNQPGAEQGDLQITPSSAVALLGLCAALAHTGRGRVLITCRYALPHPFADVLHAMDVPPLDGTEQQKQTLRLDQLAARRSTDHDLWARALKAADGNPRLIEWLHEVLERPGLDHAGILAAMEHVEARFREDILVRCLVGSLTDETQGLLAKLVLLSLPVPIAAVQALDPTCREELLRHALEGAQHSAWWTSPRRVDSRTTASRAKWPAATHRCCPPSQTATSWLARCLMSCKACGSSAGRVSAKTACLSSFDWRPRPKRRRSWSN